jgi:uncharacterized repeat protein (TIGR03803 family)
MKILAVSRYWFGAFAAAVIFSGCSVLGQSQVDAPSPYTAAKSQAGIGSPSDVQILHRFGRGGRASGAAPWAPLIDINGTLYGTTIYTRRCGRRGCGYGTVFGISPTGTKKTLYVFKGGSDGAYPYPGLIDVNGTLYGTTTEGGTGCDTGCGTVFSVSTSGSERVVHSFAGSPDGADPNQRLLNLNGTLYGTTFLGGNDENCGGSTKTTGCGTIYSITPSGSETVLHAFSGGTGDGATPSSPLIALNGTLYGVTFQGGVQNNDNCYALGCGTIYSVSTSGAVTLLYIFKGGSDGNSPRGVLVEDHGRLYGTAGGQFSDGLVYSTSTTGAYKVLYRFKGGTDARGPVGGLIDVGGTLYGTSTYGGTECFSTNDLGCGTIYSVTTSGKESIIYRFPGGSKGLYPNAGLLNDDGRLYGTTSSGGYSKCSAGCGTIFTLTFGRGDD